MCVDVESKKFAILKILLVFSMESWAEKIKSAIEEITTSFGFVEDWVEEKLRLSVAKHGLINLIFVKASFLQQVHGRVVGEGVFLVWVAPSITHVMIGTCVKIVFIFQFAWICFENSQVLPYTFDIGLSQRWLYFLLFQLLAMFLIHCAQSVIKNIIPSELSI